MHKDLTFLRYYVIKKLLMPPSTKLLRAVATVVLVVGISNAVHLQANGGRAPSHVTPMSTKITVSPHIHVLDGAECSMQHGLDSMQVGDDSSSSRDQPRCGVPRGLSEIRR